MASCDCSYRRPSNDEILEVVRYFDEEINHFIHFTLGYPDSVRYVVCAVDIMDIIIRTDKRLYYFNIFHNMEPNECKKAALFAYWIAKLRPIKIIDNEHLNILGYNDKINEMFAIHILFCVLSGIGRIKQRDETGGVDISLNDPYMDKLCYSLRFRNFTIDSMIVLADTITTETFKKQSLEL